MTARKLQLIQHPETPARRSLFIEAQAAISEYRQLVLQFELRGDVAGVVVPQPVRHAERCDGLWRTTCFEAFVRGADDRYVEVNLSPSTAWAAYTFDAYRGELNRPALDAPPIDVDREADRLRLTAAIDLSRIDLLDGHNVWMVNLTAVIEEADGTKSYWALAHPPGKPDFHHPDGFALALTAGS
jgi:hypothetical protein